MIFTPTPTTPVGEITPISVGEVIKDSKGNGTTTTLKDNPHSLHLNLLQKTRSNFKNQGEAIKKVEVQVGDLAKQLQQHQHKVPNVFPGNTIMNPNAEYKAVNVVMVEEAPIQEKRVEVEAISPLPPPRPKSSSEKLKPLSKFLEVFACLEVNMPLLANLREMSDA
ncbi:hypothetical protein PIB30_093854 [Stylosanthes scabra]|uniref:Uncharacterized protein n=1 Tax=Stylosanthes scabra TaxID=79078 RepID=A0ABU6QUL4_9FABA|nr:hypothetical protein [Stylosanthes scabra]